MTAIKRVPFVHQGAKLYGSAPSRRLRPYGLVVIEAMSLGCAVIATKTDGMRAIATHDASGLFVQPNDLDESVACIRKYLCRPALARSHGDIGRAEFLNRYDECIYIGKVRDFLANIAGTGRPQSRSAVVVEAAFQSQKASKDSPVGSMAVDRWSGANARLQISISTISF